jgi:hypothetical protein
VKLKIKLHSVSELCFESSRSALNCEPEQVRCEDKRVLKTVHFFNSVDQGSTNFVTAFERASVDEELRLSQISEDVKIVNGP